MTNAPPSMVPDERALPAGRTGPGAPPASGLRSFDSLVVGEQAPAWLGSGLRRAFGLGPNADATLISVSENASYLVREGGIPLGVARLQQPGYQESVDQLRSELDWVRALGSTGWVDVPRALAGADGSRVQTVAAPGGPALHVVLFEFVAGSILQDVDDATEWFTSLGVITARLHHHARTWKPPPHFTRFRWDLPELVGPAARWGDWRDADLLSAHRDLLSRAEASATAHVRGTARTGANFGLIHSDLRPTNVMHSGQELTVIDFDDSGFGWFMYDFAAALTFQEHLACAGAMARNWIHGYRSEAALSDSDVELGCHLSMVRTLTMLGWSTTHRSEALPPGLRAGGVVEAAVFAAERYLQAPTWLVD